MKTFQIRKLLFGFSWHPQNDRMLYVTDCDNKRHILPFGLVYTNCQKHYVICFALYCMAFRIGWKK